MLFVYLIMRIWTSYLWELNARSEPMLPTTRIQFRSSLCLRHLDRNAFLI